MSSTLSNRQVKLSSVLLFGSLIAIGCGAIRIGMINDVGVLAFFGMSMVASQLGGLVAFFAAGRQHFVLGMITGWLLLMFLGLVGLPWERWIPLSQ